MYTTKISVNLEQCVDYTSFEIEVLAGRVSTTVNHSSRPGDLVQRGFNIFNNTCNNLHSILTDFCNKSAVIFCFSGILLGNVFLSYQIA